MDSTSSDCDGPDASLVAKLVNFAAFQVVWFALVLTAAEGQPWIGVAAAASWIVVHLTVAPRRWCELRTIGAVTALGVAFDQLAVATGIQRFTDAATIGLVPVWIAALWAAFATLLRCSMSWLLGRYRLGSVLAAVLGPLTYVGAERLGAIELGSDPRWLALAGVAAEWAIVMPIALRMAAAGR